MERTKMIIFSALLIAIAANSEYVEISSFDLVDFKCPGLGFFCSGCNESYYCSPGENDTFVPQKIEDCLANGKTCLQSTGECTSGENVPCDPNVINYKFECHQAGMYPDPFICNKYYICTDRNGAVPETHNCTSGFSYDPTTALCNKKIVNNTCNALIKPCKSPGEMGSIPGHSSLYYICLQASGNFLTPQLYTCTEDSVFLDRRCQKPDTGLDEAGKCKSGGSFYKPSSCLQYSECKAAGDTPTTEDCPCGTKFYQHSQKCESIGC